MSPQGASQRAGFHCSQRIAQKSGFPLRSQNIAWLSFYFALILLSDHPQKIGTLSRNMTFSFVETFHVTVSQWDTWVVQYAGGRERVRGLPHYAAAETVSPPPPPRLSCSIIHVLSTGSTTCNHYPYRECTRACINNILFACKWNRLPTGELFPQFWKKSFGLVSELGGSEKQGLTGYRYPKKWPGST